MKPKILSEKVKTMIQRKLILFVLTFLISLFLVGSASAASVQPYSTFAPNDVYLADGWNSVTDNGMQKISISATTIAYQTVNQVGITFYLQKWTGSTWVNVDNGIKQYLYNSDQYTNTITYTGQSGYYYRAVTIHWVQQGTIYEEGQRTSNSFLLK
jgi:hypothetical protein